MSFLLLLLLFVYLQNFTFASETSTNQTLPRMKVYCQDESENQVFPEYLLSNAYRYQSATLRENDTAKRKELHLKAIQLFDSYIECMNSYNNSISAITYLQKAISQIEIGNEEAEQTLEKALEVDSRLRDAIILKSRLLINKTKYEEARDLLEKNISYFSNDSDFLYFLGSLNRELGNDSYALLYFGSLWNNIQKREGDTRYRISVLKSMSELLTKKFVKDPNSRNRAIYYIKTYVKYVPNDIETKYILSFMLYFVGRINESKEIALEILSKNPNHQNAIGWLGEIYFLTNKTEALKFFRYLYQENKINNTYLYHLYAVLQGRYTGDSKEFFENHLQTDKTRLSAYLALIEIYKSEKENEKLLQYYEKAAKLSFNYKDYYRAIELSKNRIALLKETKNSNSLIAKEYEFISKCYEEMGAVHLSLVYLRKAIQSNPKEFFSLKHQESALLRNHKIKRYQESLDILNKILNQKQDESNFYFEIGLTHFLNGNYPESIKFYTKAIRLEPQKAYYYYYRASSYEKLGYISEVRKDIQKSWEINPNFAQAYNFLGYLYAEKNIELEESFRLIKKAIELEPDNPAFQDSLGWIYYQKGNLEEALYHLQLAVELMEEKNEKDGVVYDHIGDIYFKLGDTQTAKDYWQKALKTESSELNTEKTQKKLRDLEIKQ